MKKKIKNEELYSRREFFKKAVKTALPIIATVVLVSNPVASKAAKVAMGCESYSTGSCYRACYHGCNNTCMGTCERTCQGSCIGTCRGTCTGSCTGSCAGWNNY